MFLCSYIRISFVEFKYFSLALGAVKKFSLPVAFAMPGVLFFISIAWLPFFDLDLGCDVDAHNFLWCLCWVISHLFFQRT